MSTEAGLEPMSSVAFSVISQPNSVFLLRKRGQLCCALFRAIIEVGVLWVVNEKFATE